MSVILHLHWSKQNMARGTQVRSLKPNLVHSILYSLISQVVLDRGQQGEDKTIQQERENRTLFSWWAFPASDWGPKLLHTSMGLLSQGYSRQLRCIWVFLFFWFPPHAPGRARVIFWWQGWVVEHVPGLPSFHGRWGPSSLCSADWQNVLHLLLTKVIFRGC